MSRVNVEGQAFNDTRFDRLARRLGLADGDHARGKCARLWLALTERFDLAQPELSYTLDADDIADVLGPDGPAALVECKLADATADGRYYIRGARGRVEWKATKVAANRENGRRGGRPRASDDARNPTLESGFPNPEGWLTTPAPAPAPATATATATTPTQRDLSLLDDTGADAPRESAFKKRTQQPRVTSGKTVLPDDWKPTDQHRDYATEYRLDVHDQLQRFRAHAADHHRTSHDWNAAFTNWLATARDKAATTKVPVAKEFIPVRTRW
jgi:hypothetical protein